MARIAGVNIPTQEASRNRPSLYSWNRPAYRSKIIPSWGSIASRRVSDLTKSEVIQIREIIDRDFLVEGDLRRDVAMNIKRLMDLGCYRGLRHRKSLPVRGQRTHTNARTRKGPAKAIAGKKKVTK